MVIAAFSDFMQQIVSGLASGGIFALLALALVIIHRSTGVINFAQGEMATLSTYIAWTLIVSHGWRYGPAFVVTLLISFVGGVAIHRVVIRPVERGSVLRIVRQLNEDEGLTVLVVEQDARIALQASSRAYVLEVGRVALTGTSAELRDDESIRRSYLGY